MQSVPSSSQTQNRRLHPLVEVESLARVDRGLVRLLCLQRLRGSHVRVRRGRSVAHALEYAGRTGG